MFKRLIITIMIFSWVICGVALGGKDPSIENKNKPNKPARPKAATYDSDYKGKMQMSSEKFDFGYLPKHSKVGHIFWLQNVGSDSLEIIRIKPG
jgi:hypothetical protein